MSQSVSQSKIDEAPSCKVQRPVAMTWSEERSEEMLEIFDESLMFCAVPGLLLALCAAFGCPLSLIWTESSRILSRNPSKSVGKDWIFAQTVEICLVLH